MSSSRSTIVTVVAIYTLVAAILGLCGSLGILGLGSIAGSLSSIASQTGQELSTQEQQALAAVSTGGGILLTIIGVITLVVAIVLLVDAVGLFQTKPWSWMLTLVLYGINVVLTLIGWLGGGGFTILSLILLVINIIIIYLFWTNAEVKQTLGQTK